MMVKGNYPTIEKAAAALRAGKVTSVELVQQAIEVADRLDERLGIFLKRFNESALETAAAVDADFALLKKSPLAGIPIGVKDIISTREAVTTAQSLILSPEWSSGDAECISRLRKAGAIIMGKLTTMEFATGAPDPQKPFPVPKNPWDPERWAGGSSSGSASSVSIGAVLGAISTDTGGSIRRPSAYCGISGFMPTFGRVPKSGVVPLGYTLDRVGPMARSARDCALILSVIAGHHGSDPTSIDVAVPDYISPMTGDLSGVRIGVDRMKAEAGDLADPALAGLFDAAIGVLSARGATIVDVEIPLYREMSSANLVILVSEALAYHLPDMQDRWKDYFATTRGLVGTGIFYSGADYVQAQRVRRTGQKLVAKLFHEIDILLTPTSSVVAPKLSEMTGMIREVGKPDTVHTPYWNAAGNPALTIPMGNNAEGLPIGFQIIGRPFDDTLVLKTGDAYQQATDWHLKPPPIFSTVDQ